MGNVSNNLRLRRTLRMNQWKSVGMFDAFCSGDFKGLCQCDVSEEDYLMRTGLSDTSSERLFGERVEVALTHGEGVREPVVDPEPARATSGQFSTLEEEDDVAQDPDSLPVMALFCPYSEVHHLGRIPKRHNFALVVDSWAAESAPPEAWRLGRSSKSCRRAPTGARHVCRPAGLGCRS